MVWHSRGWGSASAGELARPVGGQTVSPVGSLFQKQEEGPDVLFVVWLLFGGAQGRGGVRALMDLGRLTGPFVTAYLKQLEAALQCLVCSQQPRAGGFPWEQRRRLPESSPVGGRKGWTGWLTEQQAKARGEKRHRSCP